MNLNLLASLLLTIGVRALVLPLTHPIPNQLCFPAVGFTMPLLIPLDLEGWWCDPSTEYAFLGFSYEVTACTQFFLNSPAS
jgi:hypothetical protein